MISFLNTLRMFKTVYANRLSHLLYHALLSEPSSFSNALSLVGLCPASTICPSCVAIFLAFSPFSAFLWIHFLFRGNHRKKVHLHTYFASTSSHLLGSHANRHIVEVRNRRQGCQVSLNLSESHWSNWSSHMKMRKSHWCMSLITEVRSANHDLHFALLRFV